MLRPRQTVLSLTIGNTRGGRLRLARRLKSLYEKIASGHRIKRRVRTLSIIPDATIPNAACLSADPADIMPLHKSRTC